MTVVENKQCSGCLQDKPLVGFGAHKGGKFGRQSRCKSCTARQDRRRNWAKYGLNEEDYYQLLEKQDGKCAICRTTSPGRWGDRDKTFSIDHDHKTGVMRQLLCSNCNLGLGNFQDDPALLAVALKYLEYHQSSPGD